MIPFGHSTPWRGRSKPSEIAARRLRELSEQSPLQDDTRALQEVIPNHDNDGDDNE